MRGLDFSMLKSHLENKRLEVPKEGTLLLPRSPEQSRGARAQQYEQSGKLGRVMRSPRSVQAIQATCAE